MEKQKQQELPKIKKIYFIVPILVSIFAVITFFTYSKFIPTKNNEPLKISYANLPYTSSFEIALKENSFSNDGLQIEKSEALDENDVEIQFENGDTDLCILPAAEAINLYNKGINLKIIWILGYSLRYESLITKNSTNTAELVDKKVGVDGINSFSHYLAIHLLENLKYKEDSFAFEPTPSHQAVQAINDLSVDLSMTRSESLDKALGPEVKAIAAARDLPGISPFVLIAREDTTRTRSSELKALIKTLEKTQKNLTTKTDEIIQFVDLEYNKQAFKRSESNSSLPRLIDDIYKFFSDRGQIADDEGTKWSSDLILSSDFIP